ncbi:MAG: hypothetical protein ACM3ML_01670 [Micromonosporaceae bacterium]
MRTLLVHPSGLMYSEIFLRLEPLWRFPRVYNPARQLAGHQREVTYKLPVPHQRAMAPKDRRELYSHPRPTGSRNTVPATGTDRDDQPDRAPARGDHKPA